jgi:hypothetical protein
VKLLQLALPQLVAQRPQLHHPSAQRQEARFHAPALPFSPAAHTAPSGPTPRLATPAPGRASCRCLSAHEACMSSKSGLSIEANRICALLLAMCRCVTCSQSGSSVYIRVQSNGEPLPRRLLLLPHSVWRHPGTQVLTPQLMQAYPPAAMPPPAQRRLSRTLTSRWVGLTIAGCSARRSGVLSGPCSPMIISFHTPCHAGPLQS